VLPSRRLVKKLLKRSAAAGANHVIDPKTKDRKPWIINDETISGEPKMGSREAFSNDRGPHADRGEKNAVHLGGVRRTKQMPATKGIATLCGLKK